MIWLIFFLDFWNPYIRRLILGFVIFSAVMMQNKNSPVVYRYNEFCIIWKYEIFHLWRRFVQTIKLITHRLFPFYLLLRESCQDSAHYYFEICLIFVSHLEIRAMSYIRWAAFIMRNTVVLISSYIGSVLLYCINMEHCASINVVSQMAPHCELHAQDSEMTKM